MTTARQPGLSPPVSEERLRHCRDYLQVVRVRRAGNLTVTESAALDLLVLLDWERKRADEAEMALADALAEDGRYEAGVRAGVARALELLGSLAGEWADVGNLRYANLMRDVATTVRSANELYEAPPRPERLAARLRRLEGMVRRIERATRDGTTGWRVSCEEAHRIAREALKEDE